MKKKETLLMASALACVTCSAAMAAPMTDYERDIAIQKAGWEHNRQYDLAHGYAVTPMPDLTPPPATRHRMPRRTVQQPVMQPQRQVVQQQRPLVQQQRPVVQPQRQMAQPQRQVVQQPRRVEAPRPIQPTRVQQQQHQPVVNSMVQRPTPPRRPTQPPAMAGMPNRVNPQYVNPQWIALERDLAIQNQGLAYNRHYDEVRNR